MKTVLKCLCLIGVVIILASYPVKAQEESKNQYLITEDSIGIVKIGKKLKDLEKEAEQVGFIVKQSGNVYNLYDSNNTPLVTFSIFNSHQRTKPVRTIKTTSSKFMLEDGTKIVGNSVKNLAEIYTEPSIFRVTPSQESPEILQFKNWPFAKSIAKGPYLIKYETLLNRVASEYGESAPVGLYSNEFALYTDQYQPDAKIDSFQIEAVEPKVKF